jgi:hypothetical protein
MTGKSLFIKSPYSLHKIHKVLCYCVVKYNEKEVKRMKKTARLALTLYCPFSEINSICQYANKKEKTWKRR